MKKLLACLLETTIFVRINSAVLKYLLINNTAAENFDPACTLTKTASLTAALEAAAVNFYRWLCEWEV